MKIFHKLLITLIVVGVLPLMVYTLITNVTLRQDVYRNSERLAIEQLKNIDHQIQSILLDVHNDVLALAQNDLLKVESNVAITSFLEADEQTFQYNIGAEEQRIIDLFSQYRDTHPNVNSIYYGTVNGGFIRSHKRAKSTQYDPRTRIWYELGESSPGQVVNTDPYKSVTTDDINIGTVTSVHGDHGQLLGIVGMDVTLDRMSELTTGFSGYDAAYNIIVSDKGIILSHPEEHYLMEPITELSFRLPLSLTENYFIVDDYGVEKVVYSYLSDFNGWIYYKVIPKGLIEASSNEIIRASMVLLIVLLLVMILTTVVTARVLSYRIQNISSAMLKAGEGQYDTVITDKHTDELAIISNGFNEMVEQIQANAYQIRCIDSKTGLINREGLLEILYAYEDQGGQLVQIHIANFFLISQIYGHIIGDQLMQETASRLTKNSGKYCELARISNTNLVYFCKEQKAEGEMNSFIRYIHDVLSTPFELDSYQVVLDFKVGVIDFTSESQPDELLINLNLTTSSHDRQSDELFAHYNKEAKDTILENLKIEKEILHALDRHEIYPVFQPLVKVSSGEIYGFETLARWYNEDLGTISPEKFIPLAERKKLIYGIGRFILEEAIKFGQTYEAVHNKRVVINVNLSVVQLSDPDITNEIEGLLEAYRYDPKYITLEVTETVFYMTEKKILERLAYLSKIGISIALDDFGSGYSSINNLISMPVDYLKIDKALLWKSMTSGKGHAMIELIMGFAAKANLDVVIEGVEDQAMVEKVKGYGIQYVQGYHYSKPLKGDAFLQIAP